MLAVVVVLIFIIVCEMLLLTERPLLLIIIVRSSSKRVVDIIQDVTNVVDLRVIVVVVVRQTFILRCVTGRGRCSRLHHDEETTSE